MSIVVMISKTIVMIVMLSRMIVMIVMIPRTASRTGVRALVRRATVEGISDGAGTANANVDVNVYGAASAERV